MRAKQISRTVAAIAALGLCALIPGSPTASAAAAQVRLTTSCAFPAADPASPADPVAVPADISTELPDTATTAEPIALNAFSVSVTIPEATVAALRTAGTTSIGAGFTVALTGTWQQQPHDIAVPAMTSPDNPLPETGDLHLTATADLPPVAVDAPGDATFAVPQVVSTLTLHIGETTADVACTEDPGQIGDLGTVPVAAADPGSSTTIPPSTTGSTPPSSDTSTPGDPSSSTSNAPGHQQAAPRAGGPPADSIGDFDDVCTMDAPGGQSAGKAWYKIDGPIHMRKLGSDLVLPVGDLAGDLELYIGGGTSAYICVNGTVLMPDAPGYFVMFNFAPVTAIAHTMPGTKSRTKITSGWLTSRTETTIRLSDVKVNGVPLDVGPNCHTSTPAVIRLAGPYQGFTSSGKVPGLVDLPAFTGCANGNDVLNPLFNGLVAADGNTIVANIKYKCFYITCNGQPVPGITPATE